ncbi:MAG: hypothetical protein AAFN42_08280 [Cyanobacteria bacterium J06554_1]
MFLVQDSSPAREQRIQKLLAEDPSLSALLSVIHFEWTVRRSIIALGTSPNVEIRAKLDGCHGCKAYKNLWKEEVFPNVNQLLPDVINDWNGLLKAFRLRHRLVHGVSSCGLTYATERVEWAIDACQNIRELCITHKIDLDARLPRYSQIWCMSQS